MEKRLTASKLRENVYRILDHVLRTGRPVEIERRGHVLHIVPARTHQPSRLEGLATHARALEGDPEDLVHLDWSSEWRP
ncbi:MAG: type II toxin-antitoxin system Phd/YefM family antitoxin [Acidobacteria bacterium]|nr:type II toxin-antitoxin system Phd/YefM family antitoxin [Acidobacteriota bacterium]